MTTIVLTFEMRPLLVDRFPAAVIDRVEAQHGTRLHLPIDLTGPLTIGPAYKGAGVELDPGQAADAAMKATLLARWFAERCMPGHEDSPLEAIS